jgi:hypothetical protein
LARLIKVRSSRTNAWGTHCVYHRLFKPIETIGVVPDLPLRIESMAGLRS